MSGGAGSGGRWWAGASGACPSPRLAPHVSVALLAVGLVAGGCGDGATDPADDHRPVLTAAPQVTAVSLVPWVAVVGGDGQTLSITMPDMTEDSLYLLPSEPITVEVDGAVQRRWFVFDDGTHGDAHAGDHVFTRAGLSAQSPGPLKSAAVGSVSFALEGNRFTLQVPTKFTFRSLDTLAIKPLEVRTLAPDVQATERVVAVVTPEDDALVEMEVVGNRYYDFFPGDRDFLLIHVSARASSAAGASVTVSTPVGGIGYAYIGPYRFPGAKKLIRAILFYEEPWRSWEAPDGRFCLATHEIAHAWGAWLQGLSRSGHWTDDFLRTRSAYGFKGACVFNELELYLAGLLPADSVPGPLTDAGMVLNDVIATQGRRIPEYPNTQRAFSAATLVSVREPLTPVEMTFFDVLAREYGLPVSDYGLTFQGATGGRATLDMTLPKPR